MATAFVMGRRNVQALIILTSVDMSWTVMVMQWQYFLLGLLDELTT